MGKNNKHNHAKSFYITTVYYYSGNINTVQYHSTVSCCTALFRKSMSA